MPTVPDLVSLGQNMKAHISNILLHDAASGHSSVLLGTQESQRATIKDFVHTNCSRLLQDLVD